MIPLVIGGLLGTAVMLKTFGGEERGDKKCSYSNCSSCSHAHKETGLNYCWLNKEFGRIIKIEYEEPVEKKYLTFDGKSIYNNRGEMMGNWKPYTDKIWDIHCKSDVIDHSQTRLVEQHMKAFVNEGRFARLRFTLMKNGGELYQREPNKRFYELERDFFRQNEIKCK